MDRRIVLGAALAAFFSPAFAQDKPVLDTPLAAVKMVYDPKVKDDQRPYTKKLRALYAAAMKKSKQLNEPVPGIDFDPMTGSQDWDDDFRNSLKFSTLSGSSDKALVEVKLKVFKTEPEKTILFDVVLDGRDWKIDDISNPAKGDDGWRLSTLLIAGAKGQ